MNFLLRRIDDLEKENYNLYCTIDQCNGRIEELEAENARLREALLFYANESHYRNDCIDSKVGAIEEVIIDNGRIARNILKEVEK